jgi:hypothetical protein
MTVTPTITDVAAGTNVKKVVWTGIANGANGAPVSFPDYPDVTVVINGTFGTGGSCTLEGSLDNTNFYALTDPQGNAITKTAAGLEAVEEAVLYYAPYVTAGDGTTAINVTMLFRRASR